MLGGAIGDRFYGNSLKSGGWGVFDTIEGVVGVQVGFGGRERG